jgi:hypothetical protein
MKDYATKPQRIKAAQWNGTNYMEAVAFMLTNDIPSDRFSVGSTGRRTGLLIETPTGWDCACKGDWVIVEPSGRCGVVAQGLFQQIYEPYDG